MLALLIAAHLAVAPVQDTAHVVLVATTDLHGHMTGRDYLTDRPAPNGVARVARVVDSLRAKYPGQVVLVDAGDLLQGDPFATYFARVAPREPHPIIEAMNLAGYDAATPGNRDFDWGVPFFRRAISDARFAYVSANVFALPGDNLLLPAYRVVQRQGVRIGISGFTTPGVMVWDREQVRGKIRVGPIGPAAVTTLEAVRRDADVSIVIIHSGMDHRSSYADAEVGAENVAATFATIQPQPDVVVVGHSHGEMRDSVIDGVHFVQPKPFGGSVSVVHLVLARDAGGPWKVRQVKADLVSTKDVPPSDLLAQRLAASSDSVARWVRTPLGVATGPMRATAARVRPTAIINFINEVQRRRAHADVSATPAFDLGAGFDADTIRIGTILALYPRDNRLRAVRITGSQLKAYLEWSARYFSVDPGGRVTLNDSVPGYDYDIVGGARYDIDLRRPVGDRILGLSLRGEPVEPDDSLTMAVNGYRQSGTGGYDMLQGAPVVYDQGENIPELLMEEVRTRGPIDPADYASEDWQVVPEVYSDAVRNIFNIPATPLPEGARDTIMLRILATADLHADMLRGAASAEATMDSLGTDCGCPTLRLDAGDAMEGSPLAGETEGRAVVEVLNQMRYGAAVLGDRDFDWATDTLRRRMTDASYPWLAANVFDSVTGHRPGWMTPYTMVPAPGTPVAVFGYISPDVKDLLPDDRTRALRFGEGELAIHDVLGEIAARKPAFTILLAHAGLQCDSVVCKGEVVRLAEQLGRSGVDLIVSGHLGESATTRVGGIPIMQAGERGTSVAVADLVKTPAGGLEVRTRIVPVDTLARSTNAALLAALEFYRRRSDSVDARPIAQLKRPLPREGLQFALGGMLAEARRNVLRADVGLVRNESIASDLPSGAVTYATLTAVEPGRQDMVRVTVTGVQLSAALEHALDGGSPSAHIAGAQVRYDPGKPDGRRISRIVLQGNRNVRPADRYTLALDESTAEGAGGYVMLAGLPKERRGMTDVEVDAAFLRRLPQPVEVGGTAGFVSTRK
ncbi:MAG: 5'-nucleotidase C-terminal domain-containing protein [Gemmatimonadales bacterium]